MGALSVHRQPAAVADALVAADLDLALDVLGDVAPQVTFDLEVGVDVGAQLGDLFLGQVADARVGVDARRRADLGGGPGSSSEFYSRIVLWDLSGGAGITTGPRRRAEV